MTGTDGFVGGLAVFSGPSGSGKSSLCRALCADPRVSLSVSATTREPRPGEVDGVDYRFLTREQFQRMVSEDLFLEWAEVYGNFYGTPAEPLRAASEDREHLVVLDIDVQGARQLRARNIAARFCFVAPPSLEVLRQRLVARGTDRPEVIERRLRFAEGEMAAQSLYDHVLVNHDLAETIARARALLGLAGSSNFGPSH